MDNRSEESRREKGVKATKNPEHKGLRIEDFTVRWTSLISRDQKHGQ